MLKKALLCCLLLVSLVPTCFADGDAPTPKKETINGVWRADVSETQTLLLKVKDSEVEMTAVVGENQIPVWSGKLVLSKEHPNEHMDWVDLHSRTAKLPDNKCLYRLRNDTLLIMGGGPQQRPTRFFSGPGGEPKALLFTRDGSGPGNAGK